MTVKRLECLRFRNLKETVLEPCEGINVIFGDNAQGKTNLLESIWLFTGCRSFRGSTDGELINFNAKNAKLSLDFFGSGREQSISLEIEKGRSFSLNGIKLKSASKVMGEFSAVVFSPVHLTLVKGGPGERRKFLDTAISQLKPKYAVTLANYNKALSERNIILKDCYFHSELQSLLDVWEERVAFYGSEIIRQRIGYVNALSRFCEDIYSGISSKKEKLCVSYKENCTAFGRDKQEIYDNLKNLLFVSRKADIPTGFTSVGPHRDDLSIEIDGIAAQIGRAHV